LQSNLPNDLAERRVDQINKAGRSVYFAWAGGIKQGDPHYYRVQTPSFLIGSGRRSFSARTGGKRPGKAVLLAISRGFESLKIGLLTAPHASNYTLRFNYNLIICFFE
jgi:hypothetical protein